MNKLPTYLAEISPDIMSDLEVNFIALVESPAIEKNFQAFSSQRVKFTIDKKRKIISGPAMVANTPIYRNDATLGEYYVVFDAPSIFTIVNKFSAKGYMQNMNISHDPKQKLSKATIFNSFITDSSMGILPPTAFKDVPDGSWFMSAYLGNDPDTWKKVESGEVNGFSVEGIFKYIMAKPENVVPQKMKSDSDEKTLKIFDGAGETKNDYKIVESKPTNYKPAPEVSRKVKEQALAKQYRTSKDPIYAEAVNTFGLIYKWSDQVVNELYNYSNSKS